MYSEARPLRNKIYRSISSFKQSMLGEPTGRRPFNQPLLPYPSIQTTHPTTITKPVCETPSTTTTKLALLLLEVPDQGHRLAPQQSSQKKCFHWWYRLQSTQQHWHSHQQWVSEKPVRQMVRQPVHGCPPLDWPPECCPRLLTLLHAPHHYHFLELPRLHHQHQEVSFQGFQDRLEPPPSLTRSAGCAVLKGCPALPLSQPFRSPPHSCHASASQDHHQPSVPCSSHETIR